MSKRDNELFNEWQNKLSKRYLFFKSLPEYRRIIEQASGQNATDELVKLVEEYGPLPQEIPWEEYELIAEAAIGTGISVFESDWIARPIRCISKNPATRGERVEKINWDAYLDDRGFIRFEVRWNPGRQIKGAIETWLLDLKKRKAITLKGKRNPKVSIIGSLVSGEHPGVLLYLNPFAPKKRILDQVIKILKKYASKDPPLFSFSRRDLLHPERIKALRLKREGKTGKEIASILWPKQNEEEEEKITKIDKKEPAYEEYLRTLRNRGKSAEDARKEADNKFNLKRKTPTNPFIVKVHRILK